MWYSILLKTSLLSPQTLEFKQVTLNCMRERKCYFVARNEAKVSIVSFFIESDIHWELNVVQIVFCYSELGGLS